jgi:hypothetical protein
VFSAATVYWAATDNWLGVPIVALLAGYFGYHAIRRVLGSEG